MERTPYTDLIAPAVRAAKQGGTSPNALSVAFLRALSETFGEAKIKDAAATLGFKTLLDAEGGSVNAKAAAKYYGGPHSYTEEAVRKAARNNQVIAIRDGTEAWHFPVWQFGPRGGLLPGIKEVLAAFSKLPHKDDLAPVTFFLNRTARLNGLSPLDAVRRGDDHLVAAVIRLAHEAVE